MDFEVVRGTLAHRNDLFEMANKHTKIMGVDIDDEYRQSFYRVMTEHYLNETTDINTLYMAYLDGQLFSVLGSAKWTNFPYWTITNIKTNINLARQYRYDLLKNGLAACMNLAISDMEEDQRYRYFALSQEKHHVSSSEKWYAVDMIKGRYKYTNETIIKANEQPKYIYEWEMMNRRTWPVDLRVRSASLANEFRVLERNKT